MPKISDSKHVLSNFYVETCSSGKLCRIRTTAAYLLVSFQKSVASTVVGLGDRLATRPRGEYLQRKAKRRSPRKYDRKVAYYYRYLRTRITNLLVVNKFNVLGMGVCRCTVEPQSISQGCWSVTKKTILPTRYWNNDNLCENLRKVLDLHGQCWAKNNLGTLELLLAKFNSKRVFFVTWHSSFNGTEVGASGH